LIASGPPSRLIEEAIDGRLELILARPAMVELERILTGKLEFGPERWRGVEELLHELSTELIAAPEDPPESVSGDPDDDLILACAVQAGVDAFVSGDRRHLLPLGIHRGVRIITPQALLAELHG
jgi:uncharacterized protein